MQPDTADEKPLNFLESSFPGTTYIVFFTSFSSVAPFSNRSYQRFRLSQRDPANTAENKPWSTTLAANWSFVIAYRYSDFEQLSVSPDSREHLKSRVVSARVRLLARDTTPQWPLHSSPPAAMVPPSAALKTRRTRRTSSYSSPT